LLSNGYASLQPFDVSFQQDSNLTIDLLLQIVNGGDSAASIVSWQLELTLYPLAGSRGAVLFSQVAAPPDSLFGNQHGPLVQPQGLSGHISVSDADYDDFSGVQLEPQGVRNVIALTMSANQGCSGNFELIARAFDASAPDFGSSWFPTGASEPQGFENEAPSSVTGFMLIGTIRIQSSLQPGDYNHDQMVDGLDYQQWRSGFGSIVPAAFAGSDGSGNLVVDAADYVIWRDSVGVSTAALQVGQLVPEPAFNAIYHLLLCIVVLTYRVGKQRN
jgi:hypothetical protein